MDENPARPVAGGAAAGRSMIDRNTWREQLRWVVAGPAAGVALGVVDSIVNHVPVVLGEVGTARAERGGWSQTAEFASLILDAGWAWAATAVLVGRLASRDAGPVASMLRGAVAGGLSLVFATLAYYGVDVLFDGGTWWNTTTRYWVIGSVLLGPGLGVLGALTRRPGPIGKLCLLLVPAGAILQMVLLPPPPESRMAEPVRWAVWVAAAVAVVLVISWNGRRQAGVSPVRSDGVRDR